MTPGVGFLRRTFDVLTASAGLVLLAPLLVIIAVLIRLSDGGPALFRQTRVGEGGEPFTLCKFRSMRTATSGPQVTSASDGRVTRMGRVLRRSSLDELPQLVNVLRGDMTLVGPRPETLPLAARYPDAYRWVFDYRPGLTGPTQIRFRDLAVLGSDADPERYYLEVLVPARVRCDLTYLADPSMAATLRVIWQTVRYLLGTRID
ncbi:MAG TPA: sugar transferase [Candidatus Nanopelagicales bacterium]|jgi:lipopolysaccharide/colanic/teichoic acid biosynthesis glycosyltransferase